MKTLSIVAQKGGVGKTSITLGIGAKLVEEGHKVLFIDADAQCNLSNVFYVDTEGVTLYEVLKEPGKIKSAVIHTDNGDVIPGSPKLTLYNGGITALKQGLENLQKNYDYCLIDCPPSLGEISLNALMSADACIIPLKVDAYSLHSIDETMATITEVKKKNPRINVLGLVINEYKGNARISKVVEELAEDKAKAYNTRLFDTKIRNCIKISESAYVGEPNIFKYVKKSNANEDFTNLTEEIERLL